MASLHFSTISRIYLDLIKNGKISIEKAAKKLTKPCGCGIFNTIRATSFLSELTK